MSEQQAPCGAVSIHLFPQDDPALESAVWRAVREVFDGRTPPAEALEVAGKRLRKRYPGLVIRQRDALAERVEETTVWYVYRDGWLLRPHALRAEGPQASIAQRRSPISKITRGRAQCSVCGACHWSRSSDRVFAVWKDARTVTDYVRGPDRGNSEWTCDQCGLRADAPVAALLSQMTPPAHVER